jgi:hypothetical protein
MSNGEELTGREKSIAAMKANEKDTQFGGKNGNIPNMAPGGKGAPTHCPRMALRHVGRQPVDRGDAKAFEKLLPKNPSPFQIVAANLLSKAIAGDMRAIECVFDQVSGKPTQIQVNTDLQKFEAMTEEELHAYNQKLDERIAAATRPTSEDGSQQSAGGHDVTGADGAQGADSPPAREGEGAGQGTP